MNDTTKVVFQSNCANAPEGGFLDTLAQLGKNEGNHPPEPVQKLQKRARAKYVQQPLLLALVDQAKADQDEEMQKGYWNAFHCAGRLHQKGDKLEGRYCNNRWCLVCSRIRTGKLINKYRLSYERMHEPHSVTLTAPTVTKDQLKTRVNVMGIFFKQIQEIMKKRGTPLNGVRKLEIVYNSRTDLFHPHFHCIVEGEYEAKVLVDEWLYKNKNASPDAQHISPADEGTLLEVFKYATKLCTKDTRAINAPALHHIFKTLRKLRVFQPIGSFGKVNDDDETIEPHSVERYNHIPQGNKYWYWSNSDWKNDTGETLSGYKPSEVIEQFRNNLEQWNANNVTGNSPQKTSSNDTVQTDADNERFIPVKQLHKRPYKRPPQRVIQTEIQV